jgi:hypothetical protein
MVPSFDEAYPALHQWAMSHGWIEVGVIEGFSSMIQVLNEGGLSWEGESSYPSLDAAFKAADEAIARWLDEEYGG